MTSDYLNALKKAHRESNEENYKFFLQGLVCRLDIPTEHELSLRRNAVDLSTFKKQCKLLATGK